MTIQHNPARRGAVKKSAQLMGLTALASAGLPVRAEEAETGAKTASSSKYGIEGLEAPELAIDYWIDKDGKPTTFSVAENKGKWVFLKCFQNWCPGCHASGFPSLKAFSEEFHDHPKVAIAGIQTVFEGFSINTQDAVRDLQLKYELLIPMGHDPGNPDGFHVTSTMLNYRTGGTPWLILIDPAGFVVFNDFRINTSALIEFVYKETA